MHIMCFQPSTISTANGHKTFNSFSMIPKGNKSAQSNILKNPMNVTTFAMKNMERLLNGTKTSAAVKQQSFKRQQLRKEQDYISSERSKRQNTNFRIATPEEESESLQTNADLTGENGVIIGSNILKTSSLMGTTRVIENTMNDGYCTANNSSASVATCNLFVKIIGFKDSMKTAAIVAASQN